MSVRDALVRLQVTADLCSARLGDGGAVVWAACEALAAGADGANLSMLAGMSRRESRYDILELLPSVMAEQRLDFHEPDGSDTGPAGVRAIAQEVLAGRINPRLAAGLVHGVFGYELTVASPFSECEFAYSEIEYISCTIADVDAEVRAYCAALLEGSPEPWRRYPRFGEGESEER